MKIYPYLEVQVYSKRKYLYDTVASHTIGYVKKISEKEYENLKEDGYTPRDMIGKLGIEKTYDDVLRGNYNSIWKKNLKKMVGVVHL